MFSPVKNSTKKGAKIQNEYIWLQSEYRISTLAGVFIFDFEHFEFDLQTGKICVSI